MKLCMVAMPGIFLIGAFRYIHSAVHFIESVMIGLNTRMIWQMVQLAYPINHLELDVAIATCSATTCII